jgi:hypothetical protein
VAGRAEAFAPGLSGAMKVLEPVACPGEHLMATAGQKGSWRRARAMPRILGPQAQRDADISGCA